MTTYIKEIFKRRDLLIYLIKSGLKAEHRNSYLGYFWWLLDPLLGALIYYFLVVIILQRGGENYGVFLVIGLVAWRWTSSTVSNSAKAITHYSSIINQVYLPKAIFPITRSLSQMVNFFFGLVVIAIFLLIFWIVPGWQLVYLPLVVFVQLVFVMTLSLFIAYICVFIRDVDNILSHFIRLWFYSSPVIWEGSRLPIEYQWIVNMNPFAHIVGAYRDIFMYHQLPDLMSLFIIGIGSLIAFVLILYFYSRNEHKIIKAL